MKYEFQLGEQALNPIQKWLVTPKTFVPLLDQPACVAKPVISSYCSSQNSHLGETGDYFPPLVACIAPPSTMKASNRNEVSRRIPA